MKLAKVRRCTQTKCNFYLNGGCKNCEDCNEEPYNINTKCQRCMDCENVPDSLRWGDKTKKKEAESITPELEKKFLQEIIMAAEKRLGQLENNKEIRREELPPIVSMGEFDYLR